MFEACTRPVCVSVCQVESGLGGRLCWSFAMLHDPLWPLDMRNMFLSEYVESLNLQSQTTQSCNVKSLLNCVPSCLFGDIPLCAAPLLALSSSPSKALRHRRWSAGDIVLQPVSRIQAHIRVLDIITAGGCMQNMGQH